MKLRFPTLDVSVLLTAVAMHLSWGLTLLLTPYGGGVTAIAMLGRSGMGDNAEGILYIAAALMCIWELLRGKADKLASYLVFPQHALLMTGAIGSVSAVIGGAYLDGTVVPSAHIFCDQELYIFFFFLHWQAWRVHLTTNKTMGIDKK